nr:NADH dehydrogenase subunit 2, mitochondrial [Tanacetum cinerariifolium]
MIYGSSGIFMGILSIAVGSLFKITAVPFRAAVGQTAAYRALRRGAAVLPAREERKKSDKSASLLPFYVVVMVTGERSQRRPSRVF